MNQSERITKAAELLALFHVWGIGHDDAKGITHAMREIANNTSPMDWRNAVNRYVDPKTGGKIQ